MAPGTLDNDTAAHTTPWFPALQASPSRPRAIPVVAEHRRRGDKEGSTRGSSWPLLITLGVVTLAGIAAKVWLGGRAGGSSWSRTWGHGAAPKLRVVGQAVQYA